VRIEPVRSMFGWFRIASALRAKNGSAHMTVMQLARCGVDTAASELIIGEAAARIAG